MKLYHFAAAHMLDGIRAEGLTRGCIPRFGADGKPVALCMGWQWLTDNPAWEQSWNTREYVPYSRTACRLEVCIPKTARQRLKRWLDVCAEFGPWTADILNVGYTPEEWFVFHGRIPPAWFRGVARNPNEGGVAV